MCTCYATILCCQDLTGGGLEQLALATVGLNGSPGTLGEGMCLDGNVLGGELLPSDDDLVDVVLGLGDGTGLEEALEVDGGTGLGAVELIEFDNIVDGLGMSRSHGSADELGKTAVEGLLSTLEAGAGGTAGTGLLSAHTEAAGGALAGGDAAALALLLLAGARSGLEVVEGEFGILDVVEGGLIGGAALPVKYLHGKGGGGGNAEGGTGSEGGEGGCYDVMGLGVREDATWVGEIYVR